MSKGRIQDKTKWRNKRKNDKGENWIEIKQVIKKYCNSKKYLK